MTRDTQGHFLPATVPPNFADLTGQAFGRLRVTGRAPDKVHGAQRKTTWECVCECGNTCVVTSQTLKVGSTQSCGCYKQEVTKARRGDKHQCWKGGRTISRGGYVLLTNPQYPGAPQTDKTYQRFEHVVVMSRHLGRPLLPGENVHHINGVKDDNRIENLELWSVSQPSGQRVDDKTSWAVEWLEQYAPHLLAK